MHALALLLLACGTPSEPSVPAPSGPPPTAEAPASEPTAPEAPAELPVPEGSFGMQLELDPTRVDAGIAVGEAVDLVSEGGDGTTLVVAEGVQVLAVSTSPEGLPRMRFALSDAQMRTLTSARLPAPVSVRRRR